MNKKALGNIGSLGFGIFISIILLELLLTFFNPFPARIRGDKIILTANLTRQIELDSPISGLDTKFQTSYNSLGLRGPEPVENPDIIKIITVGGSTTECSLLDDSKTWANKLYKKLHQDNPNIWLNNAGLDGASTYGHLILLEDYLIKLKPDYIIFLFGINDKGKASFDREDGALINRKESWIRKLSKKSEILTLSHNLLSAYRAKKVGLDHNFNKQVINVPELSKNQKLAALEKHNKYLPTYQKRVEKIITMCFENGIQPIFVTQTLLYKNESYSMVSLELYNDVTRKLAKMNNIILIDLEKELAKDPTYYYDGIHYTIDGAEEVSDIIYSHLKSIKL